MSCLIFVYKNCPVCHFSTKATCLSTIVIGTNYRDNPENYAHVLVCFSSRLIGQKDVLSQNRPQNVPSSSLTKEYEISVAFDSSLITKQINLVIIPNNRRGRTSSLIRLQILQPAPFHG